MAVVNALPAIGAKDVDDREPLFEVPDDDSMEFPGDDFDPIDVPDSTQDESK